MPTPDPTSDAFGGAATSACSLPAADQLRALATGVTGLSKGEAAARLARFGWNEPVSTRRTAIALAIAGLFKNPLVMVLLLAALVSGVLGDMIGAMIIVTIVLLSIALNAFLSDRSRRAAARLSDEVVPTATVCRDGEWLERPRRELVPGDIIRLGAGDRVPADARLLAARDLHVQQAALTGESVPVEKEAADFPLHREHDASARHLVFLGTSVVAGSATAVVFATGRDTAFGDVAEMLNSRPPRTEFERGLDAFARLIMRVVLALVLFVLAAGIAVGRPPIQSLLFAFALAVGLTPEFMPMILTVTLARGAVRMARRHVIVKHLAAIEDFGSMTVLLSDKTGTLTNNNTNVASVVDPFGAATPRAFELAYVNSKFETGIRSPLDAAILRHRDQPVDGYHKVDEIPFDFERRRLCVVVECNGIRLLIAKGAPESMLAVCTHVESAGKTQPLGAETRLSCKRVYEDAAERGLRALAVAYRVVPAQPRYGVTDETGLILAGFVLFEDAVEADVSEALQALARDGVATKILTGDNERVAYHVCQQVGFASGRIVLGEELDALDDTALGALAEQTQVFARVTPAQKYRIVQALRARGQVVGFLGDGINDAPSLHAADVGISVANAVDVARDAADIVLRERDLHILHAGVVEGRKAFSNVMKYLLMGTSSNFGNMISMAAGALFLPFLPMLPTQILLNNFLYDLAQITIPTDNVDAAQIRQPTRWRVATIQRFMLAVGPISSIFDFLTFYALLHWLQASEHLFQTGWFVESLATQVLVLFVIRTTGSPWRSRPSAPLVVTMLLVVAVGVALPTTPLAAVLGFVPLPPAFFLFLVLATFAYLLLVEIVKRQFAPDRTTVPRIPGEEVAV